jgi:predicted ATPase with chaperone activity
VRTIAERRDLIREQAHFTEERARVQIREHHLAAVFVLEQNADRAFENQVQRLGLVARMNHRMLGRQRALVRLRDEGLHGRLLHEHIPTPVTKLTRTSAANSENNYWGCAPFILKIAPKFGVN